MIPAESAHDTIEALGDVGLLEFKDLNPDKSAFQRSYASQVRFECDAKSDSNRVFDFRHVHVSCDPFWTDSTHLW